MKAFLCELILSCTLATPGVKPIDELTYGTVLFDYFQQDYQGAMLATLVAEEQGRLGEDAVRFELAKGSFAFSDGMYEYARETFENVAAEELTNLDQLRLAFHLAREYHRRSDWTSLETELGKIDLGRTWFGRTKRHPEVEFMRADLDIQNQQFDMAWTTLGRLDEENPLRAYGLYNLGVAYRATGDLDGALKTFDTLGEMPAYSDETRDLAERARLAMAFITREQGARAEAADVLGRLPGTGRYRDIALAAYGGLAMDNEDYELAARIWLTLQNQDYWTSATAAARLGFPVSLENLASREMALVQYRAAEQSFEHRLAALNELSGQAEDSAWVRGLLLAFSAPDEDPDQMGDLMVRWREELGHTNWLEWLATEHVHNVLLEWRDLLDMKAWLGRLPNVIEAFDEVTQEQRRRGMAARSLLHDQELLVKRDQLNARLDEVGGRLAALRGADAVPEAEWMLMLAKPDERELIVELNSIQALIDKGMTAAEQRRWIPRVERLQGVLFWRLVDESSTRLRELDKSLIDIQQVVQDVDARIERAQSAEDQFVAGVATDYLLFTDRAQVITSQVDQALDNREQELANELRRGMQREMREVEQYLLITRIAIARATDQLAEARVDAPTGDGE